MKQDGSEKRVLIDAADRPDLDFVDGSFDAMSAAIRQLVEDRE